MKRAVGLLPSDLLHRLAMYVLILNPPKVPSVKPSLHEDYGVSHEIPQRGEGYAMHAPSAVAIEAPTGNYFVSDSTTAQILVFKLDGHWIRSFGEKGEKKGQFLKPVSLMFDLHGKLLICDLYLV